jgi:hypothetical protein
MRFGAGAGHLMATRWERAIAIRETSLGAEHPGLGAAVDTLAWVRSSEGKLDEAEHLYRRALRIQERCLGPDHLVVAGTLDSLASIVRSEDKETRPSYSSAGSARFASGPPPPSSLDEGSAAPG